MKKSIWYLICFFLFFFLVYVKEIMENMWIQNDEILKENFIYSQDYENLQKEYADLLKQNDVWTPQEEFITSKVLIKDPYHFYEEMTILKGEEEGVGIGDAVTNQDGFIGIVTSVQKHSSQVRLLLNPQTQIPVAMKNSYGILQVKEGQLLVTHITSKEDIEKGTIVYTSKYSKIPYEIPIGTVTEVEKNSKEQTLKITPLVDIEQISYVSIRKAGNP